MRKRIYAMILTVLLAFSMIFPVSARDDMLYIIDQRSCITGVIPELNAKASAITDTYGINVSCLLTESTGGMGTAAYVEQVYKGCFGEEDGIMLIESTGDMEWYLYKSGTAEEIFTVEDEDMLWEAFALRGYYDDSVNDYLDKAHELLEEKTGIVMDEAAMEQQIEESQETEIASESGETETPSGEIPDERLQPRLVDEADLLSDDEESELLAKLDEISERQKCDVAVVTVDSLEGKTAEVYADDYYDYNGYGFGEERDGILLLVSMEDRNWHMSTCGYGITAFTDAGMEYMADKFTPLLSDGFYSDAFIKYAELCDDFITQAKEGKPYDKGNLPKGTISPIWILLSIVIGLVIAYILGTKKKRKLKSVIEQASAQNYTVPGSMMLTVNWDRLVNRTVTTRVIVRDDDDGGSSTHSSSSGTSHGGSGGSF